MGNFSYFFLFIRMKIYIFFVVALLLSGVFATCSSNTVYTSSATCVSTADTTGLPCCWWKVDAGALSSSLPTITTGCALLLAFDAESSVVTAKNKALLCALAGSRNAYDTTNGY